MKSHSRILFQQPPGRFSPSLGTELPEGTEALWRPTSQIATLLQHLAPDFIHSSTGREFFNDLESLDPLSENLSTILQLSDPQLREQLVTAVGADTLRSLVNLSEESDREIFYQDLLNLGTGLAAQEREAVAVPVLAFLSAGPEGISTPLRQRADQEFQALLGQGPLGGRLEVMSRRLMHEATDWRVIVPMMAGSTVYQLGRTASLARFGNPLSKAWYARGLGLRGLAGTIGYTGEVLTFANLSRGLRQATGDPVGPYGEEMASAALTLGLLKASGFIFHRMSFWAHGMDELGHATRLAPWQRVSSTVMPQLGIFSGLMAARGLESWVGWQAPITDGGALITETLGTMFALSVGTRLGHTVLGPRFHRFTQNLGRSAEIYAQYADRGGPPPAGAAAPNPGLESLSIPEALDLATPQGIGIMAMSSHDGPGRIPPRRPSPIGYSWDPTAVDKIPVVAANADHLVNSLSMLYAHYSRDPQAKPEILQAWSPLFERLGRSELETTDVETMWQMFQVVAQDSTKHYDPWFSQVARWFGAADHHVKAPNGIPQVPAWDTHVDPLKFSALMYTLGLSPEPQGLAAGMRRYLMLPPELRTHFTDQMVLMENLVQRIRGLTPDKINSEMQHRLDEPVLRNFLERSFIDLKDLLLEHHSHPALIYHSISNTLFGGNEKINVFRVHIDVTTFNEQDGTNFHGNVLLDSVKSWFQEKFGRVSVVQNPERTTFEFIAPSARQVREIMADFQLEVKVRVLSTMDVKPEIVADYMPRAVLSGRTLSRDNIFRYAIQSDRDLETYRDILAFGDRIDVDALRGKNPHELRRLLARRKPDFNGILRSGDARLTTLLNAMVLQSTIELKSQLAAQTTFFEKELADIKRWRNGRARTVPPYDAVFEESDLPSRGPLAEKWRRYLRDRSGYVGPGQYDPGFQDAQLGEWSMRPRFNEGRFLPLPEPMSELGDLPESAQQILRSLPRLAHLKGMLSHSRPETEGGLIQQFHTGMMGLATAPAEQIPERLTHWQEISERLLMGFAHVHSLAVTDPRNAWTPKQHREFWVHRGNDMVPVRSNFFVQEVGLARNPHLAVLEYDSFKAFFRHHATHDVVDSQFNQVRDAIFLAARELDMPVPLVNPTGGDHISISFSDRNLQGETVDPNDFCQRVQRLVREKFQHQPFQDFHKVSVREIKLKVTTGNLEDPQLLSHLQENLELSTPPIVSHDLQGIPILKVPTLNRHGRALSTRQVMSYLRGQGVRATPKLESVQIYRLPMWQAPGTEGTGEADFIFSRNQPEGYLPFSRQLTVSMVFAKAPTFRDARDVARFLAREDRLGIQLGEIKAASWPQKQGLADHRGED